MSGHSHWATIKRQKQAQDVKRGKIFSKLSKAISVAVRHGGENPGTNPALRAAIEKARSYNMPKDNIERAIGAASEAQDLVEGVYEGYGPSGVAFMVKVLTDNKNRTLAEIRKVFDSHGGRLGEAGSAAYVFTDPEKPTFTVPVSDLGNAKKLLALATALDEHDDVQEVYSNFDIPDEILEKVET
ncbi:YebC/PmpR family DNA-binding transcriptional regulator [Candidatus Saccharibacteria bacterium]|nr:YebC/PmpR family DNA-binding transcriptional regulator [Candidatus Saccharibacteria bacterium]